MLLKVIETIFSWIIYLIEFICILCLTIYRLIQMYYQPKEKSLINLPNPCVVGGKYKVLLELGSGSFGKVFLALGDDQKRFAVKVDHGPEPESSLIRERLVYSYINKGEGIPKIHFYTHQNNHNFLVMDLLGMSLHELQDRCGGRFSLKTTCMIAIQAITRLEYVHSKYIIHRDVKPSNFLIGCGDKHNIIHMVDYGLSAKYRDHKSRHLPNKTVSKIGTPLFSSLNVHMKETPSRRDDLESLAYMLIFFYTGTLPWAAIATGIASKTWGGIATMKQSLSVEQLCKDCPKEFCTYLGYCRQLGYDENPDYKKIKGLFTNLATEHGIKLDNAFDWVVPPYGPPVKMRFD